MKHVRRNGSVSRVGEPAAHVLDVIRDSERLLDDDHCATCRSGGSASYSCIPSMPSTVTVCAIEFPFPDGASRSN